MTDDDRRRESLENLLALAYRDLGTHRVAARTWRWMDRLLVGPAALLAVGSGVVGLAGLVDRGSAAAVALVGAALSGISIMLRLPDRARRSLNALTYLRMFTAEVSMVLTAADPGVRDDETLTGLRRWYMRLNEAIGSGPDELRPDLLEFPSEAGAPSRRDLVG